MRLKLLLFLVAALALCASASAQDAPRIVKRFHLYNQSGAIGQVTVYTPKAGHGGMFRNTYVSEVWRLRNPMILGMPCHQSVANLRKFIRTGR
jgi:hypothetical protein